VTLAKTAKRGIISSIVQSVISGIKAAIRRLIGITNNSNISSINSASTRYRAGYQRHSHDNRAYKKASTRAKPCIARATTRGMARGKSGIAGGALAR